MCLAIPMRITAIAGNAATVELEGVRQEISLMLLNDARVGDYVIVHAGFAIQRLDEESAKETIQYFKEMGELSNDAAL
jgi:hydrogenase expression/formation protein HypC